MPLAVAGRSDAGFRYGGGKLRFHHFEDRSEPGLVT